MDAGLYPHLLSAAESLPGGFAVHLGERLSNEMTPSEKNDTSLIHVAGYVEERMLTMLPWLTRTGFFPARLRHGENPSSSSSRSSSTLPMTANGSS